MARTSRAVTASRNKAGVRVQPGDPLAWAICAGTEGFDYRYQRTPIAHERAAVGYSFAPWLLHKPFPMGRHCWSNTIPVHNWDSDSPGCYIRLLLPTL